MKTFVVSVTRGIPEECVVSVQVETEQEAMDMARDKSLEVDAVWSTSDWVGDNYVQVIERRDTPT